MRTRSTIVPVVLVWAACLGFGGALPLPARQVTLPLNDFERLRERGNPAPDLPPSPPLPYALERAEIEIAAAPGSARVVTTLTISLYGAGWQKIPLGDLGLFVAADLGGLEGRVLAADGTEGPALAIRGGGRHAVRLESVLPVERDNAATRPTWRLALRPPRAGVARGTVAGTLEAEEAELSPGGLARPAAAGGGSFRFVAPPGEALILSLYGRQTLPERARLPLRFEATSASAVSLSRTRLSVEAYIEARVAQGRLTEVALALPPGFEVVRVAGPIAGWNVERGRLTVAALAPAESVFGFGVELSGPPVDAFAPPLLVPEGADRVSYLAMARLEGDGLLRLADPGATRAPSEGELSHLPPLHRSAPRPVAVTDPARPPRFEAAWAERTQMLAAQVDRLRLDAAVGEAGRASYRLWLQIRNRGAQQITVTLPPGFELAAASRDGKPVVPGAAGGALSIPLLSRDAPQVVYLAGLLPLSLPRDGDFALPLPALSAPVARIEVQALLPAGRRYELDDPTRAGGIQPPPRPVELAAANEAVANVAQQVALPGGRADADLFRPLGLPPGFVAVTAAWSALSATPAPLALRVRPAEEKTSWF
jgi:hypothetical protein